MFLLLLFYLSPPKMKGECDMKFSEMRENISNHGPVLIEPECKRMKSDDVLREMGLAMLDDDGEPFSSGDAQTMVSMHSPYDNPETRLLCHVKDDLRSFRDPFGDDFTVFRRHKSNGHSGEDYFRKLSDEMVLSIFRWLPQKTLKQCALVCRRWRNIACDEELWLRVDLGSKTLCPENLADIIKRGIRILRLAQADIPDPVFGDPVPGIDPFPDDYICRVQFLDLSMAVISEQGLVSLLTKTKHLVKLSLEHCKLNDEVCKAIAQNPLLEVLNLSMAYNLTPNGFRIITSNCQRLAALNVGWTGLNTEALDTLTCSLSHNLIQLNISGCRYTLADRHVSQLVKNCPKLTELDISDANRITADSIEEICLLDSLEHLSISRCYLISNLLTVVKLSAIPSLRYLDLFGLIQENNLPAVKRKFMNVKINQFFFSSIARPTVGIRRTSIWGLKTRD